MQLHPNLMNITEFGCFAVLENWSSLKITGLQCTEFLHRLLTNNVRDIEPLAFQPNAFLNQRGQVLSLFNLYNNGQNEFSIIEQNDIISSIKQSFDSQIFNDRVNLSQNHNSKFILFGGLKPLKAISEIFNINFFDLMVNNLNNKICQLKYQDKLLNFYPTRLFGQTLYILEIDKTYFDIICDQFTLLLKNSDVINLTQKDIENLKIEYGQITNYESSDNLLELGLENDYVSTTKGCFPGQEFLTRIKTHNSINYSNFGLIFQTPLSDEKQFLNTEIKTNDKIIGQIKAITHSSILNTTTAIARLHKDYRIHNNIIEVELKSQNSTTKITAKTVRLPFTEDFNKQISKKTTLNCMNEFVKTNDQAKIDIIIDKLIYATQLDESNYEAYESLAVILEKSNRVLQAIEILKKLVKINPDYIMAHTNLSIFYMQLGMINEAENEKAIATSLQMLNSIKDLKLNNKDLAEINRRLNMFLEVLKIDLNDTLANYEAGCCLFDLDRFEDAIPYFNKNLELNPNNSNNLTKLAQIYLELKNYPEACKIAERGLKIANQKNEIKNIKTLEDILNKALQSK